MNWSVHLLTLKTECEWDISTKIMAWVIRCSESGYSLVAVCEENWACVCEDKWARNNQKNEFGHLGFYVVRFQWSLWQRECSSGLVMMIPAEKNYHFSLQKHWNQISQLLVFATSKCIWLTLAGIIVCFSSEEKEKINDYCREPATQLSPPGCHRCLTNRSVRGYEKSPQYYLPLLKHASLPITCNQM